MQELEEKYVASTLFVVYSNVLMLLHICNSHVHVHSGTYSHTSISLRRGCPCLGRYHIHVHVHVGSARGVSMLLEVHF